MSKSLKRVKAALEAAGQDVEILEMAGETRTAQQAADQAGCALDQIAKSILFRGAESGAAVLFITAGGNRVDAQKAAQVAGEALERADATFVRAVTGFAIGGVAPIAHKETPHVFFDPRLLDFELVFAAGGTPRHIFGIHPEALLQLSGATKSEFVSQ